MVDEAAVLAALGYPPGTPARWEPRGESPGSSISLSIGGERPLEALVRQAPDADASLNHLAVSEALARAGYPFAPRLLAIAGEAAVEEAPPAATAMQLVPPPGSAEAAMAAFAALHALPIREGLDWERSVDDLVPLEEPPLHRLGFGAAEREPARGPFLAAQERLRASPFGFAHRNAIAANVLLGPARAWLTDFSTAGFGPQLFDPAAFLLTAGIEPAGRRALAAAYARHRGQPPDATVDLVDLCGIAWGIGWLLELPRRLITSLGDDVATDALKLASQRVEKGMRQPAGDAPEAAAIRRALWPAR